jgi:dipeptidyl aminopeptidase/acylaminoacyl peptidase
MRNGNVGRMRRGILGAGAASLLGALLWVGAPSPLAAQAPGAETTQDARTVTAADYAKAAQLLPWTADNFVKGDAVDPVWIAGSDRFWYRTRVEEGHEFMRVDPVANTRAPLFDRHRLASALSLAADTAYVGTKLPFRSFDFAGSETRIAVDVGKRRFECDIRAYDCVTVDTLPDRRAFAVSPDSTVEVFMMGHDLYVRPFMGGDTVRLTNDGEAFFQYGAGMPSPSQVKNGTPQRPQVSWAPDSRRLAVVRPDERGVEMMHYISYTPARPRHFQRPYALPGDSIIPQPVVHVLDLPADLGAAAADADTTKAHATANHQVVLGSDLWTMGFGAANYAGAPGAPDSAWTADSQRLRLHYFTRGAKKLTLAEVDGDTGTLRVLAADSARTNVIGNHWRGAKSFWASDDGGTVIWWSERDGWGHLYRVDDPTSSAPVITQLTSGPWAVGNLVHVDEERRLLYFTGRGREEGRNVYYAHLYRVGFDGSGLTLLTPEDANHDVSLSPSGSYFVDVQSRIEQPPVSVLRRTRDGSVVRELESADVTLLEAAGWRPAQVFTAKARDGVTEIYGIIHFPADLDTTRSYPVLEYIYPGPFVGSVGDWSFKGGSEQRALANLGFVVVQVDHLGTPYRSKAMHDAYYGDMGDNGIADHVAAVKQLAARYPFMDLDRVGIWGHSGGGFASTAAILRFPDFYKVAVSGAGNHDQRTYGIHWGPLYQGLLQRDTVDGGDNYESQANQLLAENLKGRLLLMHGDMDDNVHPAMTIQVVNRLIAANKDFDLIIAPDRAHGLNEPYFIRRRWDYFVEHLLGAEPPREFEIVRPEN